MKQVRWTDNICTVGWTCVTGRFTFDELDELLKFCPQGSISHTFCEEGLSVGGRRNTDDYRRCIKPTKWNPKRHLEEHGYYFSFPEDYDGQRLLDWFRRNRGFKMIRGEGSF